VNSGDRIKVDTRDGSYIDIFRTKAWHLHGRIGKKTLSAHSSTSE
jgi:hypothetical protein